MVCRLSGWKNGFRIGDKSMQGILDRENFAQVGYVVHDIETTKRMFAALLGVDVPDTVECGSAAAETEYLGKPAPDAKSKLAFFNLKSGVQLELIEPNEYPSTWHDDLARKGEGIHHIAFQVKDMDQVVAKCEEAGMTVLQKGFYDDRSGRYVYLDGNNDYKCVIELLESF